MPAKISKEKEKDIVAMLKTGMSAAGVAERAGVHQSSVYRFYKEAGRAGRKSFGNFGALDDFLRLVKSGKNVTEASEAVGVSKWTGYGWSKKHLSGNNDSNGHAPTSTNGNTRAHAITTSAVSVIHDRSEQVRDAVTYLRQARDAASTEIKNGRAKSISRPVLYALLALDALEQR